MHERVFTEMYKKMGFFNNENVIAGIIAFATNKWHYSSVSNLYSETAQSATHLGLQMSSLIVPIYNITCVFEINGLQSLVNNFESLQFMYIDSHKYRVIQKS